MYRIVMLLACLGFFLFNAGCDMSLEPSKRPPVAPGGIAPTGGLDELSQPAKQPARPAPAAPGAQQTPGTPGTPPANQATPGS